MTAGIGPAFASDKQEQIEIIEVSSAYLQGYNAQTPFWLFCRDMVQSHLEYSWFSTCHPNADRDGDVYYQT